MSWDLFVQDIPKEVTSVADIPDDFTPKPVGARRELIEKICSVVPNADFSDPSWGTIEGPDYSIDVNIGKEEKVQGFAFHVRGGDMAAFIVADILDRLNLRAFDTGSDTGIFTLGPNGSNGQKKWRAYREEVLRRK